MFKNPILKYKSFTYIIVALLLTLTINVASAAQFNVDNFDNNAQLSNIATACTTATGADMLGGERNILVERTSGSGTVQADVDTSVADSFAFSVGASTQGRATIQLDGADGSCALNATGLGGITLNPFDGLSLLVREVDLNAVVTLRVYTDAANFSTFDYTIPYAISAPGQEIYFPFNQFTATGLGADFANVGAIEIVADGTTISSLDMTIDFVSSDFARDYGDLPASYNNTTRADNGARHIVGGLFLGSTVDTEPDGQENATAVGDAARTDDEEGVAPVAMSDWGDGTGTLSINMTKPSTVFVGCIVGWIDWDNNGAFDATSSIGGVSELVVNNFFGVSNPSQSITTPTLADYGGTYPATLNARFRIFRPNEPLFTALGLTPDFAGCTSTSPTADVMQLVFGDASDGEVEDYQWGFTPTAIELQSTDAASQNATMPFVVMALVLVGLMGTAVALYRRQTL